MTQKAKKAKRNPFLKEILDLQIKESRNFGSVFFKF